MYIQKIYRNGELIKQRQISTLYQRVLLGRHVMQCRTVKLDDTDGRNVEVEKGELTYKYIYTGYQFDRQTELENAQREECCY